MCKIMDTDSDSIIVCFDVVSFIVIIVVPVFHVPTSWMVSCKKKGKKKKEALRGALACPRHCLIQLPFNLSLSNKAQEIIFQP